MLKRKKPEGEPTPPPIPEKEPEAIKTPNKGTKFVTLRLYNPIIFKEFKETIKRKKRVQAACLEEALLMFIKKYEINDTE